MPSLLPQGLCLLASLLLPTFSKSTALPSLNLSTPGLLPWWLRPGLRLSTIGFVACRAKPSLRLHHCSNPGLTCRKLHGPAFTLAFLFPTLAAPCALSPRIHLPYISSRDFEIHSFSLALLRHHWVLTPTG